MRFVDPEPKQALSDAIDLIAIETGNRKAREHWQQKQLQNLLQHASTRSPFWRKRLGTKRTSDLKLSDLPVLTRDDVIHQVKTEGSLLRPEDGLPATRHSTSGSSGIPVRFFVSEMNTRYNIIRVISQYLMEGRDLSCNRTRFIAFDYNETKQLKIDQSKGFTVETAENWLGGLGALFKSGINKNIKYWHPNRDRLVEELSRHAIGYLVIHPRLVEALFQNDDFSFLKTNRTEMLVSVSEELSPALRQKIEAQNIAVRGNYSSEEVGLIGSECAIFHNQYHVAQSNVCVEADKTVNVAVGDLNVSRILVTHLHSYATPFIRYDVGDLGVISDTCRCGHDGPTISNVIGRNKSLVKHADGKLTQFRIDSRDIINLAQFREYRIRQTTLDTIVLELSGCDDLTEHQRNSLIELIGHHAGSDFAIDVRNVKDIDWGSSVKRPGFLNEVL
jgi:phenylacetate-CoA ligase